MAKENTKSVLEEAVLEMQSILEAADKNAKNKIAKELPEKFEKLLSEEINKLKKKESVNESAKDEKEEEPHDEGKKEDTDDKEESQKDEMNEMDIREMSIEEVEEAYETASDEDLFETIDVDDIAAEIDEMAGMQNEVEYMQEKEFRHAQGDNPNDPYSKLKHLYEMMSEMINEMDEAKMHEQLHEKFDTHMKEMYGEGYTENMGEEKCTELYEMYKESKKGKMDEGKEKESEEMKEQVSESKMNEAVDPASIAAVAGGIAAVFGAGVGADQLMQYLKSKHPKAAQALEQLGSAAGDSRRRGMGVDQNQGNGMTEEYGEDHGEEMDENLTNTHAAQRKVQGGHSPNLDVAGKHREQRTRPAMREGDEKKLKTLMAENKKLSKQLTEIKSETSELESTNESYKGVLAKYRNQLQEMAVLNTNIAHVNNILIKEGNLSIDEKKNIVNKFKSVDTITESEKVYKGLLSEMVNVKKETLDEGIDDEAIESRFNDSIDPSSSKKITEQVVEKTALGNSHLDKIKASMRYQLGK